MSEFKPSDFANLDKPSCSIWRKSEIEWLALAYVQALANDGDTWKRLTRERVKELLTEEQRIAVHPMLSFDHYQGWFDAVSNRINSSDGALSVGGFWNERRLSDKASESL